MIGNSILRKIVRSYPFAPIASSHQRTPCRAPVFKIAFLVVLMYPRRDQFERLGLVFVLTPLLLHIGHNARGYVRDTHGRFGSVDMLSTRSGGAHGIDFEFRGRYRKGGGRIFREGGKDGHGHGRRLHFDIVDGDALDAMHARFVLEETVGTELSYKTIVGDCCIVLVGIGVVGVVVATVPGITASTAASGGYDQTRLLHPTQIGTTHAQHLDVPGFATGTRLVGPSGFGNGFVSGEDFGGEETRLIATGTRANVDYRVGGCQVVKIIGVQLRYQRLDQFLRQWTDLYLQLRQFLLYFLHHFVIFFRTLLSFLVQEFAL
mmetsp:Transcript_38874/g.66354  ORF Transcript_38874/g.66354 Transcript_38874/m.66354 type:complete len:319 (+) Transcript_38874:350-1306(+)